MSALKPILQQHQLKLFISNKYAYAQIARHVGDQHSIVMSASTIEKGLQEGLASKADKQACTRVGQVLGERALAAGIDGVQWARKQGQRYHGRVAAIIEGMRSAGVKLL